MGALDQTRKAFYVIAKPEWGILEEAINLFFDQMVLIGAVAQKTDDEKYIVETLITAFRRVFASAVLLESGLMQEAQMQLRNAIDLMLISIDITYSKSSLDEWKKTEKDNLREEFSKDWYFSKQKICKRIKLNEENIYPDLERDLAVDPNGEFNWSLAKEWVKISNEVLHTYSQAQLRSLFDDFGSFQLLGLKDKSGYKESFKTYSKIILTIISLLIGVPRYRKMIGKSIQLTSQANNFAERYKKLMTSLGPPLAVEVKDEEKVSLVTESKIIKKGNIKFTKSEMAEELKKLNLNFDISSFPDNAVIYGYEIDLTDPKDPVFKGTFTPR